MIIIITVIAWSYYTNCLDNDDMTPTHSSKENIQMSRILGVAQKFPDFSLPAVVSIEKGKEFAQIDSEQLRGRWSVVFFWPLDFTFVCPTEIAEFNKAYGAF